MTLNYIVQQSQNKLMSFLGYDPKTYSIHDIEAIIHKECFSQINLNEFSSISTCFRLINLKDEFTLNDLDKIIQDTLHRVEFLGYQTPTAITPKIVKENGKIVLKVYECDRLIYHINICKDQNQTIRWLYQSLNIDNEIGEIDKELPFSYLLTDNMGIDKSTSISIGITIGIINELLAYLGIKCSMLRINFSKFLYIYEGSEVDEEIENFDNFLQFMPELFLFEVDEIRSYVKQLHVNIDFEDQSSWETFHFHLT